MPRRAFVLAALAAAVAAAGLAPSGAAIPLPTGAVAGGLVILDTPFGLVVAEAGDASADEYAECGGTAPARVRCQNQGVRQDYLAHGFRFPGAMDALGSGDGQPFFIGTVQSTLSPGGRTLRCEVFEPTFPTGALEEHTPAGLYRHICHPPSGLWPNGPYTQTVTVTQHPITAPFPGVGEWRGFVETR